jgi:phosphoribosyl 1,2-cyclic phosphodiesterase
LRWANGLAGKLDRLLVPLSAGNAKKHRKMKQLKALADKVNSKRNAITHQGEFCNEGEAKEHIEHARAFITTLVGLYDEQFALKERKH